MLLVLLVVLVLAKESDSAAILDLVGPLALVGDGVDVDRAGLIGQVEAAVALIVIAYGTGEFQFDVSPGKADELGDSNIVTFLHGHAIAGEGDGDNVDRSVRLTIIDTCQVDVVTIVGGEASVVGRLVDDNFLGGALDSQVIVARVVDCEVTSNLDSGRDTCVEGVDLGSDVGSGYLDGILFGNGGESRDRTKGRKVVELGCGSVELHGVTCPLRSVGGILDEDVAATSGNNISVSRDSDHQ